MICPKCGNAMEVKDTIHGRKKWYRLWICQFCRHEERTQFKNPTRG